MQLSRINKEDTIDILLNYFYSENMKGYIVSDPKILGGKLVIRGTRIPVDQIIFLLKNGFTLEAIREEYPQLDIETLSRAVDEAVYFLDKHAPQVL